MLSTPSLWLGNEELLAFAPLEPSQRDRRRRRDLPAIMASPRRSPGDRAGRTWRRPATLLMAPQLDLTDLHDRRHAARQLRQGGRAYSRYGSSSMFWSSTMRTSAGGGSTVLRRASGTAKPEVVRRAFQVLAVHDRTQQLSRARSGVSSDQATHARPARPARSWRSTGLTTEQLDASWLTERVRTATDGASARPCGGAVIAPFPRPLWRHPPEPATGCCGDSSPGPRWRPQYEDLRRCGRATRWSCEVGFRNWLGPPSRIAVDPETGLEYRWEDVVAFSDDVDEAGANRPDGRHQAHTLLREGMFLFSGGTAVGCTTSCPRECGSGSWAPTTAIRSIGWRSRPGTSGQFDLAININQDLPPETMRRRDRLADGVQRGPAIERRWWRSSVVFGPITGSGPRSSSPATPSTAPSSRPDARIRDDGLVRGSGHLRPGAPSAPTWTSGTGPDDAWSSPTLRLPTSSFPCTTTTPARGWSPSPPRDPSSPWWTRSSLPGSSSDRSRPNTPARWIWPTGSTSPRPCSRSWARPRAVACCRRCWMILPNAVPRCAAALSPSWQSVSATWIPAPAPVLRRQTLPAVAPPQPRRHAHARAATLQEIFDTYGLAELTRDYPEARARFFRETVFRDAPPHWPTASRASSPGCAAVSWSRRPERRRSRPQGQLSSSPDERLLPGPTLLPLPPAGRRDAVRRHRRRRQPPERDGRHPGGLATAGPSAFATPSVPRRSAGSISSSSPPSCRSSSAPNTASWWP